MLGCFFFLLRGSQATPLGHQRDINMPEDTLKRVAFVHFALFAYGLLLQLYIPQRDKRDTVGNFKSIHDGDAQDYAD